jgi:hypothetical protein
MEGGRRRRTVTRDEEEATDTTSATSHDELYRAREGRPELVEVPPAWFLAADGRGKPDDSPEFEATIGALYAAAYTIRFALERAGAPTRKVAPLEGLWWSAAERRLDEERRSWRWTLLIRLPPEATDEVVVAALADAAARKPELPVGKLRVEELAEGLCAQVLHRGPYSTEGPTIEALHAFVAEQGRTCRGRHHEIYLGDPRRSAPERLRTLIRQPVA